MSRVSTVILACLPLLVACKKKPVATSHVGQVTPDPPALPSGPIEGSNGGCLRETSPLDGGI